MATVLLEDTDSQLAKLVDQVSTGEEVTILRGSIAVAKIVPLPLDNSKRVRAGYGAGKEDILYIADDFDAPLDDFKDYM